MAGSPSEYEGTFAAARNAVLVVVLRIRGAAKLGWFSCVGLLL
jgi:hypothetical protein